MPGRRPLLEPVDYSDLERVPEEPEPDEPVRPRRKAAAKASDGDFEAAVIKATERRA